MIEIDHVSRRYGGFTALDDVSLQVERGEFLVLIGSSGSGKSTLLQLINRLQDPTTGTIRLDGEDVASQRPEVLRRRIGYVIQGVGLFPHWTVARNIATVPTLLGWERAEVAARVDALLGLVRLDVARFRDAYPHALSGGQMQRVGVARALAANPSVLLMDEPFGALDPLTRAELQAELRRIHHETGATIVFVTHDMDEALRLADRIALLEDGRLLQVGTPLELLARPASSRVTQFVGGERGLRLLAAIHVAERTIPGSAAGEPITGDLSLAAALSEMVSRGVRTLPVRDPDGVLHLADLVAPS